MTRLIHTSLALAATLAMTASAPVTAEEPNLKADVPKQGAALLLPAIQKVREAAAKRREPTSPSSTLGARPSLNRMPDGTSNTFMFGEKRR